VDLHGCEELDEAERSVMLHGIRGAEYLHTSMSTRPTRLPWEVRARVRFTAAVELPIPAVPEATATRFLTLGGERWPTAVKLDTKLPRSLQWGTQSTRWPTLTVEGGRIIPTGCDVCKDRPTGAAGRLARGRALARMGIKRRGAPLGTSRVYPGGRSRHRLKGRPAAASRMLQKNRPSRSARRRARSTM
jgi:hypothetical protein